MRSAMAASMLACLLSVVAVPASAQMPAPSFAVEAMYDAGELEPGNRTTVVFRLTRHCANAATVQGEQALDARFMTPTSVAAIAGPMQVVFPQQVCASEPSLSIEVSYDVHLDANATRGTVVELVAAFQPHPPSGAGPTLGSPGNEVAHSIAFEVADAPTVASAGSEPAEQDLPMVPGLLVALALLVAAFAARRR